MVRNIIVRFTRLAFQLKWTQNVKKNPSAPCKHLNRNKKAEFEWNLRVTYSFCQSEQTFCLQLQSEEPGVCACSVLTKCLVMLSFMHLKMASPDQSSRNRFKLLVLVTCFQSSVCFNTKQWLLLYWIHIMNSILINHVTFTSGRTCDLAVKRTLSFKGV